MFGHTYTSFLHTGLPAPDEQHEPDVEVNVQQQEGQDGDIQQRQTNSTADQDDDQIYTEDTGMFSLTKGRHWNFLCKVRCYLHITFGILSDIN